jgi:dUTP pyrophosphatase
MEEIKFKKLVPNAQTPTKEYSADAGFDLYCSGIQKKPKFIECHTGIAVEIPEGKVGLLFPRSSITKKDLMLKNSVGVIDSTYRGELVFRFNDTKQYTAIQKKDEYQIGERIGQIIFVDIPSITLKEVEELSETMRGTGGFGSTGK